MSMGSKKTASTNAGTTTVIVSVLVGSLNSYFYMISLATKVRNLLKHLESLTS